MRVLQVGFGTIGREVWHDYSQMLRGHEYMVRDLRVPVPDGYEWDGKPVDVAVILVDTPAGERGFDYTALLSALAEYEPVAEFLLIRSTVGLDFLDQPFYREHAARIGFSPEFYGATKWSRRAVMQMGFTIWSDTTPEPFRRIVGGDHVILGSAGEVILAKLAENAYLATKVTFFHELALAAREYGLDAETVRYIVGSDPRIGHAHTYMEEPGWTSHCFDKDVPEYARTVDSGLVRAACVVNHARLLHARKPPVQPEI